MRSPRTTTIQPVCASAPVPSNTRAGFRTMGGACASRGAAQSRSNSERDMIAPQYAREAHALQCVGFSPTYARSLLREMLVPLLGIDLPVLVGVDLLEECCEARSPE